MVGTSQHGDASGRPRPKEARAAAASRSAASRGIPFLSFDGEMPCPPAIALDVLDKPPLDWPKPLADVYGDVWSDPAAWARRVKELGADLVNLRLVSTHPDEGDRSARTGRRHRQGGARRGRSAADHLGLRRAQQGHAR